MNRANGAFSVGPALVAGPLRGARDNRKGPPTIAGPTKPSRLWIWFVAAMVLQAAVWSAWLIIAAHHRVAEVPLATAR
jgi:hypothetical protein